MSAYELACFLKTRQAELDLSTNELARRSRISRQTWHRLTNAEVTQAKIHTIVSVARALQVSPMRLMEIYFGSPVTQNQLIHHQEKAINY